MTSQKPRRTTSQIAIALLAPVMVGGLGTVAGSRIVGAQTLSDSNPLFLQEKLPVGPGGSLSFKGQTVVPSGVTDAALSPNGKMLAYVAGNKLVVCDTAGPSALNNNQPCGLVNTSNGVMGNTLFSAQSMSLFYSDTDQNGSNIFRYGLPGSAKAGQLDQIGPGKEFSIVARAHHQVHEGQLVVAVNGQKVVVDPNAKTAVSPLMSNDQTYRFLTPSP